MWPMGRFSVANWMFFYLNVVKKGYFVNKTDRFDININVFIYF